MSNYYVIGIIIGTFIDIIDGYSGFIGRNCVFSRDNTSLSQNVVLLHNCLIAQIYHIAQYIQLLILKVPLKQCIEFVHTRRRILLIKMASNVHSIYRMENKPIQNPRGGGIKRAFPIGYQFLMHRYGDNAATIYTVRSNSGGYDDGCYHVTWVDHYGKECWSHFWSYEDVASGVAVGKNWQLIHGVG